MRKQMPGANHGMDGLWAPRGADQYEARSMSTQTETASHERSRSHCAERRALGAEQR